jgi:hypothetical protein
MTNRKKHTKEEISTKLAQASELAKQGKLQSEIAGMLGVSVMTLHRWRKPSPKSVAPALAPDETAFEREVGRTHLDGSGQRTHLDGSGQRMADLQLENSRLRRLVTDLLLEKMKLVEDIQGHGTPFDRMNMAR